MSLYPNMRDEILSSSLTDKCIILDLDETLVSTQEDVASLEQLGILSNPRLMDIRRKTYLFELDDVGAKRGKGVTTAFWGVYRPYLREFLSFCFSYFKIVAVWSAGKKGYVETIVDDIFRDIRPPHIIFTYDDIERNGEILCKPITKIAAKIQEMYGTTPWRPWSSSHSPMTLSNTFALDDRETTFNFFNPDNGVVIPPYDPKPNLESLREGDTRLLELTTWLMKDEVRYCSDIRDLDKSQIFRK